MKLFGSIRSVVLIAVLCGNFPIYNVFSTTFGSFALSQKKLFDTAEKYSTTDDGSEFRYQFKRQRLHHAIVKSHLSRGPKTRPVKPTIIFTAGPFGAGKSVVIQALQRAEIIDLEQFLWIDPDQIKEELPEFEIFKKIDKLNAATMVHRESGHIQEQLLEEALSKGINIIVDGSLRNGSWWSKEFKRIQSCYPSYAFSIIYVKAEDQILLQRVASRAKTGRDIPPASVIQSQKEVAASIEQLKKLTDATIEISNEKTPRIISFYKKGYNSERDTMVGQEVPLQDVLKMFYGPSPNNFKKIIDRIKRNFGTRVFTPGEFISNLSSIVAGKKVVFVEGYKELGYINTDLAKEYISRLVQQEGNHTLFILNGTTEGIGWAYDWIPELAEKMGFIDVQTAGLLERESNLVAKQNYLVLPGNEPSSEGYFRQKLELAKMTNGTFYFLKGGEEIESEIHSILENKLRLELVKDNWIQPKPQALAQKLIAHPSYEVDGTKKVLEKGKLLSSSSFVLHKINKREKLKFMMKEGDIDQFAKMSFKEFVNFLITKYPELLKLGVSKEVNPISSVEDELGYSFSEQMFGIKSDSFDRVVTKILYLRSIYHGDYNQFIFIQKNFPVYKNFDLSILSQETFSRERGVVISSMKSLEDFEAVTTFIVLKELTAEYPLNQFAEIAPGFQRLSPEKREIILQALGGSEFDNNHSFSFDWIDSLLLDVVLNLY